MTKLKDDQLLLSVKRQLAHCAGFDGDELTKQRADALDYYFQRPRGDEVPGRSQVVSGDVSAMVEANLAQMLEAFSTSALIEFGTFGADDEDQAQLEADICAELVMGRNNGFLELAKAVKDELLLRNGVMRCWIEEKEVIEIETLTDADDEALAIIESAEELKPEVIDRDGPTARVKIKRKRKEFRSAAVPLENFIYTKEWHSLDVQDIPCIGERFLTPRSDLVAYGFKKKKVTELKKAAPNSKDDAQARNPFAEHAAAEGLDESQDVVEWYKVYVLADRDGDGISERLKVCFSDNTLLSVEEVSTVPYAIGTAIINPHRLTGVSIYDKVRQVQDVTTGLERALLDNVNTATKNRTAGLDGKVNRDDLDNGRPDGHIRVKSTVTDVRAALMAFNVPDLTMGILANIQHQGGRRSEAGGAALELATGEMQLNDRVGSQGLDRAYSVMEQLAAMMTKLTAATLLRSLFLLTHRTLREEFDEDITIKVKGRWHTANPSQWRERETCNVKPGMSPGERARRASTLMTTMDLQFKLAESGEDDTLVNSEVFYRALMDWHRANDVQNPEQYFLDPQSEESLKAAQMKQANAARMQQMQQKLMDQALQIEQLRVAVEKYSTDAELQFKYFDAVLDAEIKEAEIAGNGVVELLKATREKVKNGTKAPGGAAQKQSVAA